MRAACTTIVMRFAAAAVALEAAHVATAQCETVKVTFGSAGDYLAETVGIAGTVCVLGAPGADRAAPNAGAALLSEWSAGGWGPLAELPRPLEAVQAFGAVVCANGERIVIGSLIPPVLYVLERDEFGAWEHVGQCTGGDSMVNDFFGAAVSLSGDTLVAGAYNDSNPNGGEAGSAYVFERDPNGVWTQTQKLLASDGQSNAEFGKSVAIDGDVIVVGAWNHWIGQAQWAGKAYIFERDPGSGVWIETARLRPPVSHTFQSFGIACAIDADVAVVGAYADIAAEPNGGAAYVFERGDDGVWSQSAQLLADDPQNSQFLGCSVAIAGDQLLVGARGADEAGPSTGAAYLFAREPDGVWRQQSKLTASDGQSRDEFGYSVALDGTWAVLGAWKDDDNGTDSGSAYLFDLAGRDCNANDRCDSVDIAEGSSADANGNGWPDECEAGDCAPDLDDSGMIDLADLSALLSNFGLASGMALADGDLDGDGDVDLADLSALLGEFGLACP